MEDNISQSTEIDDAVVASTVAPGVGGMVAKDFQRVAAAFGEAQQADAGGAQLCIYRAGCPVVDVWAGRDTVNDRPFTDRTLAVLMSCTKGAVAICATMLVERGQLDLDARVSDYWPACAQNGKADIRVRQLLNHSAGLIGFEPESGIDAPALFDWSRSVAAMEAMAPLWPPGSAYAYHFITYGLLVGEVIRRAAGKTVGRFFADEVAGPLGLDLWIGLPEAEEPRVAPHFTTAPSLTPEQWRALFTAQGVDMDSRLMRTVLHTFATTNDAIAMMSRDRAARAVEMPAGNGVGNARALAKMYAALMRPIDGVRLIRRETLEAARTDQTIGLGAPEALAALSAAGGRVSFGLGFELSCASKPMLGPGSFGHSGAGGRLAFAFPEQEVAVGYVCNAMVTPPPGAPDPRWIGWTAALHEALAQ